MDTENLNKRKQIIKKMSIYMVVFIMFYLLFTAVLCLSEINMSLEKAYP